ncbi:MAG: phosphatase PAP2 family protein [Candidatus Aegiribacteria sp.]
MRADLPASLMTVLLLPLVTATALCGGLVPRLGEDIDHLFHREPMLVLGSGGAAATAAFLLENPEGDAGFMGHGFLDDASMGCHHAFGPALPAGSVLLWGLGSLSDASDAEKTGRMLTEGLLITYGITGVLKLGAGRERPDGSGTGSFPSGHSSGTACAAVVLWDRYGPGAGVPAAALAAFTALSRVQLGRHYPSDVIAGTAIGISVGLAVVGAHGDAVDSTQVQPALGLQWSSRRGFGVYF